MEGYNIRKLQIPGIGMRIIKSALAVFICYMVNYIRPGGGYVFYSLIAALWCIQMYRSNTLSNAIQRTVGTCVGAVFGLLYLLSYIYMKDNNIYYQWMEVFMVSIGIILVLYVTVLLNKKQASYFSCVVFLSIVVNHISDANPYVFVWNRFLDTMIGVIVGIIINDIRLCVKMDKETLFISGLDDTLLNRNEILSAFSKVELNRMIDSGMKFTVSTKRTPASLIEATKDIRLNLPVIAMDGAVLYDIKTNEYIRVYVISRDTSQKLMQKILESNINWYANVVIDDTLVIFYGDNYDDVNKAMINDLKTSPLRNYINRPLPANEDVVYFMLLGKDDAINEFYHVLMNDEIGQNLKIVIEASKAQQGYSYIKIYNNNATKDNMIKYLKEQTGIDKVVTFGTIKNQYDVFIKGDDANQVVRKVRKRYEPILFLNKVI